MYDKYQVLFDYFRQCPFLGELMSIAALEDQGNSVIFPNGSSSAVEYYESKDMYGNYECTIKPLPSVYEDFQINCYRYYDVNDTNPPQFNTNVLTYAQVCKVCEWVEEQNANNNFPNIGEKVVAIECYPFVPQIRFTVPETNTVCYFITVRLRYVNRRKEKVVPYAADN